MLILLSRIERIIESIFKFISYEKDQWKKYFYYYYYTVEIKSQSVFHIIERSGSFSVQCLKVLDFRKSKSTNGNENKFL
jgi:hypothetical protein